MEIKHYYFIYNSEDKDGWGAPSFNIINVASERRVKIIPVMENGKRYLYLFCLKEDINAILSELGSGYKCKKESTLYHMLYKKFPDKSKNRKKYFNI